MNPCYTKLKDGKTKMIQMCFHHPGNIFQIGTCIFLLPGQWVFHMHSWWMQPHNTDARTHQLSRTAFALQCCNTQQEHPLPCANSLEIFWGQGYLSHVPRWLFFLPHPNNLPGYRLGRSQTAIIQQLLPFPDSHTTGKSLQVLSKLSSGGIQQCCGTAPWSCSDKKWWVA